jgi:hypothetical protein
LQCSIAVPIVLAGMLVSGGSARAAEQVLSLRIARRKIDGPGTLRVVAGDQVELRWTTDEVTTVHIHGYDLTLALDPAREGRLRFVANATGRYPVSAHGFGAGTDKGSHREVVLVYLEVLPE